MHGDQTLCTAFRTGRTYDTPWLTLGGEEGGHGA